MPAPRRGRLTRWCALATLVTATTLSGGCGDGPTEQATAQLAPQQGPAALIAGSAGFKCHPWNKHSGACGNLGGASGTGSSSGAATGGVAGSAGTSGSGGAGAAGGQGTTGPYPILSPATSISRCRSSSSLRRILPSALPR